MKDDDGSLLAEYVLNETGKLFVGTEYSLSAKPWVFNQVLNIN